MPGVACERAAILAEQRYGLPHHLLAAIGTVESGRRDPSSGRVSPWPYTANIGGLDSEFANPSQAAELVAWARAKGAVSVDVGCFQVSLQYHPDAFRAVGDGFKPRLNADYAARFLRELFAQTGNWDQAISRYHSAEPVRGAEYLARVMQAWHALDADAPVAAGPPSSHAGPIPVYDLASLPAALRRALFPRSR